MLSGKEKAQVLLSSLGAKASDVLKLLSPESASLLTSSIADTPQVSPNELAGLFNEVISTAAQSPAIEAQSLDSSEQQLQTNKLESIENNKEPANIQPPETEPVTPEKDTVRIAHILSKQKPQIIAFFLTKVDEDLRKDIYDNLPINIQDYIENASIESIPLSDSVFQHLYDSIINYQESENEEGNEFTDFSSNSEDSSFGSSLDFGNSFGSSDFGFGNSTDDDSSDNLLSSFGSESNEPLSLLDDQTDLEDNKLETTESTASPLPKDLKEEEFSL
jgi:hypothetical protein